jgi:hypothetical protein
MADQSALDAALSSVDHLRKTLAKSSNRLVRNQAETTLAKATALAWFTSHKPTLMSPPSSAIDDAFRQILECSDRAILRTKYVTELKELRKNLLTERSRALMLGSTSPQPQTAPPNFQRLVGDTRMQEILNRRWKETRICIEAGADLAATVMMGGLLEGLLLARVNALSDKAPLFKAATSPRDKAGKPIPLKDWMLKNYLDVAHELNWIGNMALSVGTVLRDYRNYIHPAKEFSHGLSLSPQDSEMSWVIFAALTKEIIAGAAPATPTQRPAAAKKKP